MTAQPSQRLHGGKRWFLSLVNRNGINWPVAFNGGGQTTMIDLFGDPMEDWPDEDWFPVYDSYLRWVNLEVVNSENGSLERITDSYVSWLAQNLTGEVRRLRLL